ncbi:MAG: hypothetical protein H7Z42_20320 [Roseiflexaceae bacterium]|nr:hypothetical protein [Roseiflexaceae bacterium]
MSDYREKQDDGMGNTSEAPRDANVGQPDPTTGGPDNGRDAVSELVDEVRELGNQIEAAFRAALESDRTRQLQRDLMGGLKELSSQLRTAVKDVQENPRVQQASDRGKEVLRNAQHSRTAQELQETLVSGVAQLNMQLRKLVDRLETTPTNTPTQQVPVEHTEATGPTVRLDPDQAPPTDTTKL